MYKKLLIFTFLLISLGFINTAIANTDQPDSNRNITFPNPLGDNAKTDPNIIIGQVINAVLGVVGSLALVMFIYGGFTWMTASGSQEKVRKGREILVWATLGLIVIFSSYALVRFVLMQAIGGEPVVQTETEDG